VDKVVCTCSTIGDIAERFSPSVMRVDRHMAISAIIFSRIHVLASLKSTIQPTKQLVEECARMVNAILPFKWQLSRRLGLAFKMEIDKGTHKK
jgi:hypothetical protein